MENERIHLLAVGYPGPGFAAPTICGETVITQPDQFEPDPKPLCSQCWGQLVASDIMADDIEDLPDEI